MLFSKRASICDRAEPSLTSQKLKLESSRAYELFDSLTTLCSSGWMLGSANIAPLPPVLSEFDISDHMVRRDPGERADNVTIV